MTHFEKIIAALEIFKSYAPELRYPFRCINGMMYVHVSPEIVTEEDKDKLVHLNFLSNGNRFSSYTFGDDMSYMEPTPSQEEH